MIILDYFESVFSLESFLLEINCKMQSIQDDEKLKSILKQLQQIVVAFDFNFKGPFKSYIDNRFSFEQLLLLCYLKVQESKLAFFENHMFKQPKFMKKEELSLKHCNLSQSELEIKLSSTENLSICYFLSKDKPWREFYSLIGFSIMKYLIIYSFMFERLGPGVDSYVQISGSKFTSVYKTLVARKLRINEINANNSKNKKKSVNKVNVISESKKKVKLSEVFEQKEFNLIENVIKEKSVDFQLKSIGQSIINKTVMLYNRNLGPYISPVFIYSDKKMEPNQETGNKLINMFILKNVYSTLEQYPNDKNDLDSMKKTLSDILARIVERYNECPFQVFRSCYCKGKENTSKKNVKSTGTKRKLADLDSTKSINKLSKQTTLEDSVEPKKIYCFLRRCLMFIFEYKEKPDKMDLTCPILGGKSNFNLWIKKFRQLISGLKFDKICLNGFLHGLKFSRISYLTPIKCDKFKRLILLMVNRWLIEDFALMIIRALFFVTDTSKTNSNLFYFLKSDWRNIVRTHLSDPTTKKYKKEYNLEKIRDSDVFGYCSRYESLGYYLGRLLPKNVGSECRIISGCRIYNPCYKRFSRSNFKFITLNNCLKWLIQNDPTLLGFACVNHRDIQNKYSKFLSLNTMNRSYQPNLESSKKWSLMKFDIQKCFDSINIDQMIDYLTKLFNSVLDVEYVFSLVSYSIIKYDLDKKQLQSKRFHLTLKHHLHDKGFLNGISDFIKVLKESNINRKIAQIIVPQGVHERNVSAKILRSSLNKCLKHVIIKIHDEIFERVNGILQGSNCSRNFCDLYLGRIEKKLFKYIDHNDKENNSYNLEQVPMLLRPGDDLILRIVDDYLVISSDFDRMLKINTLLKTEFKVNEKKTIIYLPSKATEKYSKISENLNYDVTDEGLSVASIDFLSNYSNELFSWCGFDFDVKTLDIYFNYEKYFISNNSSQNRINYANNYQFAYSNFNLKFLRLFNMNVSNLILDTRINSIQAILRNYVDVFAVSVIRFTILHEQMPSQIIANVSLQFKIIINPCYLFDNKISVNLKHILIDYFYSSLSLAKFICLRVYSILLPKVNKTKYNKLIKMVHFKLKKLEFVNCIKFNKEFYLNQLNEIIGQQVGKFFQCFV